MSEWYNYSDNFEKKRQGFLNEMAGDDNCKWCDRAEKISENRVLNQDYITGFDNEGDILTRKKAGDGFLYEHSVAYPNGVDKEPWVQSGIPCNRSHFRKNGLNHQNYIIVNWLYELR